VITSVTPEPDRVDDGTRVIARSRRPARWLLPFCLLQAAQTGFSTWRLASEETGTTRTVVLTIGLVVLVALVVGVVVAYRFRNVAAVVLTDAELRVERRAHPVVLRRDEVVAVRGNILARPTWSDRVLVQTRDGLVTLPPLDRAPGVLIPELQEWAQVSEQETPRRTDDVPH
jgi:hypothetical protein